MFRRSTPFPAVLGKLRLIGCKRSVAFGMALMCAPPGRAAQHAVDAPKSARAPEVRFSGETVTLPIVLIKNYPFIEGSIAGVRGKLMLDTGAEQALAINDHRVPLVGGIAIGSGLFGSGQRFAVRLVPRVTEVHIAFLSFAQATTVQAQDARQLESIAPDFLGWLGYDSWAGYAMKLDYKHRRATFYKGGPKSYLKGERIIAELPFEVRKLPRAETRSDPECERRGDCDG